jgi:hypothetical protein
MKSVTFSNLKSELKALATNIRKEKTHNRWEAQRLSYQFRHKHICHCLLRGRTMEQIENKTREDNKRDQRYLDKLLAEYRTKLDAEIAEWNSRLPKMEEVLA